MKSTLSLKEFPKVLLFTILMLVCGHDIHAQQTTLTVDCQTPGWLSSKIGYKDQLSVKNLTVTGYLNGTDIKFIRTLAANNALRHIDMSSCEFVSLEGIDRKPGDALIVKKIDFFSSPTISELQYVILPFIAESTDTLIYNSPVFQNENYYNGTRYDTDINKYLHFTENVDSINEYYGYRWGNFTKVHFSSKFKHLKHNFIHGNGKDNIFIEGSLPKDVIDMNCHALNFTIENDTVILPQHLKSLHICSLQLKDGAVLYIPKSVEVIKSCEERSGRLYKFGNKLDIYCESSKPISISGGDKSMFLNCKVHVPIGSAELYKNQAPWSYATIVEDKVAVTGIELDQSSISLSEIGQSAQLTANVLPNDATNKNVTWSSSNPSVAIVSKGNVVCVGYGTAVIFATTEDGAFMATCVINVTSGIEGVETDNNVTISEGTITLTNVSKGSLIRLTDLSGKTIYKKKLQDEGSFTTPQFAKGMYILSVGSKNYKLAIP